MLSEKWILKYLIDKGYVDINSFLEGNIFIKNISSRNHNFMVSNEGGLGYIFKQGIEEDAKSISNEAAIYKILESNISKGLTFIPKFYGYDEQFNLIILEKFESSQDLHQYFKDKKKLSHNIAYKLGKIMTTLHSVCDANLKEYDFRNSKESDFIITCPNLDMFHSMSPANIQLVKIIQQYPLFCKLLNDVRKEWKPQCLVHCDLKWDNFLIQKSPNNRIDLKLIDWELACYGDPAWDMGCLFTEYLKFWVYSIPFTGQQTTDRDLRLAMMPIENVKLAIRVFWNSYRRRLKSVSDTNELILKSTKFAALRMVYTVFQLGQFSNQMSGNSIWLLQLAFNTLQKPEEAIKTILGLSI